jgi:ribosomal-protein-alanine N-acetyltransferase
VSKLELETPRLVLSLLEPEHAPAVVQYLRDNREHFAPYAPPHAPGQDTEDYWRERLVRAAQSFEEGRSLELFLLTKPERAIAGDCALTNLMRGPFQAAFLGYKLDRAFVGRGLMFEALERVIEHAFREMRLHRVMANYLPTNEKSGALLRRLGFQVEGYARDYVFLNGAWRDHVLTSRINPAPMIPDANHANRRA